MSDSLKQYIDAASPAIQREFVDSLRRAYRDGGGDEAVHVNFNGLESYCSARWARRDLVAAKKYPYPKVEQPRLYKAVAKTKAEYRVVNGVLQQRYFDHDGEWFTCTAIFVADREGINDLFDNPTELVDAK